MLIFLFSFAQFFAVLDETVGRRRKTFEPWAGPRAQSRALLRTIQALAGHTSYVATGR
jgi:hypothetical protein